MREGSSATGRRDGQSPLRRADTGAKARGPRGAEQPLASFRAWMRTDRGSEHLLSLPCAMLSQRPGSTPSVTPTCMCPAPEAGLQP